MAIPFVVLFCSSGFWISNSFQQGAFDKKDLHPEEVHPLHWASPVRLRIFPSGSPFGCSGICCWIFSTWLKRSISAWTQLIENPISSGGQRKLLIQLFVLLRSSGFWFVADSAVEFRKVIQEWTLQITIGPPISCGVQRKRFNQLCVGVQLGFSS